MRTTDRGALQRHPRAFFHRNGALVPPQKKCTPLWLPRSIRFCLRRAKLRGFHVLRDAPPQAVSREFKAKSRPSSGSGRRIPQIWSVRRIPQKLKQWRSGKLPTIGDALSDWQPQKNRKRSEKQFGSFFQSSKEVDSIRTTLDLLEKYFHFFRGDSVEKLLIRISQQKRKRQKYPRNPNVLHRSFSDLSFNFFGKRGRRNSAKSASTTRACSTN